MNESRNTREGRYCGRFAGMFVRSHSRLGNKQVRSAKARAALRNRLWRDYMAAVKRGDYSAANANVLFVTRRGISD